MIQGGLEWGWEESVPHIPYFNEFEYWRKQAAETRALAEGRDDVAKATILRMANDCDKLAVWAAVRIQDVKVT
jgi:hypothetical protein